MDELLFAKDYRIKIDELKINSFTKSSINPSDDQEIVLDKKIKNEQYLSKLEEVTNELFWAVYNFANKQRYGWLVLCFIFYAIGTLGVIIVTIDSFLVVFKNYELSGFLFGWIRSLWQ